MSSTTDRSRGQALAIFVVALMVILLAAALAFDTGSVLLARRDQQNAADAAAMGGARYIVDDKSLAISTARQIADFNGFTQGGGAGNTQSVAVNTPPSEGQFAGFRNAIEVKIDDTRPSIFASIANIFDWDVGARAVAAQLDGVSAPWSILALDPDACPGLKVTGQGYVDSIGTIHVNATCDMGIQRQGPGTVRVSAEGGCTVVGGFQDGGGPGELYCGPGTEPLPPQTGAGNLDDPLIDLPPPCGAPWPTEDDLLYPDSTSLCAISDADYPEPPDQLLAVGEVAREIPDRCPGGANAATLDDPGVCQFQSSYAGTTWYLSPGIYPGGIKLQAGTFYMLPGIYYIGGGGFDLTGNGTFTYSVASKAASDIPVTDANGTPLDGGDADDEPDVHGGVLLFNTQLPNDELPDAAQSDLGPIGSNGSSARIYLAPLTAPEGDDDFPLDRLVIYQDRRFELDGYEVTLNGSSSNNVVRGVIYVPLGNVRLNGNGGTLTFDQVIAADFVMNGDSGTLRALNNEGYVKLYYAAGLIE